MIAGHRSFYFSSSSPGVDETATYTCGINGAEVAIRPAEAQ
jgi:hypothetical protein